MKHTAKPWKLLHRIVHLKSPWVTVYADKMEDEEGKELEYWHYERPDSVVVLAIQGDRFLLPRRQFRPGIGGVTLDFAGGRIPANQTPEQAAHGLIVKIKESAEIRGDVQTYNLSSAGRLRQDLRCAQCRVLLDEYLLDQQ